MADAIALYQAGRSITDISGDLGLPKSTVRFRLARAGVLRSRGDGVRLAATCGKLGRPGPRGPMSEETKAKLSASKRALGEATAVGLSVKPNGYIEYTRGANKGRSQHVVIMEARIGRRLHRDEVVHHIDGDRSNNHPDNLALMTRAAHTRLHRREERLAKGK